MADLNPDPDMIEQFRKRLRGVGRRPSGEDQMVAYLAGFLSSWVTSVAKEHGTSCDGCPTCAEFIRALSMVAAHHIDNPSLVAEVYLRDGS